MSHSSQGSDWPDWSGWWSEEVKRVSKLKENEIGTNLKHLQTPSVLQHDESDQRREDVVEEQQQNMENDGDKQVIIHTACRFSKV